MAIKLTVAIVGDLDALGEDENHAIRGLRYPEDWRIPYPERPSVVVEVDESAPLGGVLADVARNAGALPPPWASWDTYRPAFIAFYRADRDADLGVLQREVALLNDDGLVRWSRAWTDEPVSEYLRAGAAGVLNGDPRRPYLLLHPPMGNGLLSDFPTFVELWRLWWDIAEKVGIVAGIWAGWRLLSPRHRTAKSLAPADSADVVEGLYATWRANGGRPDNLIELLGQRPWHLDDLAAALGCNVDQAEALLIGFGHETTPLGLWIPGTSPQAQLLRGSAEYVIHEGMAAEQEVVASVLRRRATHFAQTGQAPPVDWPQLGEDADE